MKIVLIGASTGGPKKISKIISSLEDLNDSVVIIAQHMAHDFLGSFSNELNKISKNKVLIAQNNTKITPKHIYICEEKTYQKNGIFIKEKSNHFNPDINALFNSFVGVNSEVLGVILTGIGDDGVEGCVNLSQNQATCITETKKSAIIDGMPSRAREKNITAFDFDEILAKIVEFVK